ncbi:MAG: hypothetical protein ABFD08_05990 [Syntrophomonas sp.]
MLVKELIEILSALDPEKNVVYESDLVYLPIRQIYERHEAQEDFYVLEYSPVPGAEGVKPIWTDPIAR